MAKKRLNRIKLVMVDKEISVDELAAKIGKHPQSIIAYRNNNKQPPLAVLYQIAKALDVSACDLLVKDY